MLRCEKRCGSLVTGVPARVRHGHAASAELWYWL
jgi:hypothetical protein